MKHLLVVLLTALCMLISTHHADARSRIHCNDRGCSTSLASKVQHHKVHRKVFRHHRARVHLTYHKHAQTHVFRHEYRHREAQDVTYRPADCRGIPWCGCWLRHTLGIADKSLNLAAEWLRRGSNAQPSNANVVVWPSRHHVGLVLRVDGAKALVRSGNSGRGGITERWINVFRGFHFRRI